MTRLRATLIGIAIVFFLAVSWFGRPAGLWNSPDETANAFWSERVANGLPLSVRDAVVGLGAGAIHPRSMTVSGDALLPGSFSGLILLYGALHLFTKVPLFLFTPILTLVAGLFFGACVSRVFDRRVGALSAILFFLHPAVVYYAARGLFHNVLFVDLLVLSVACFILHKDWRGDICGGFLFGWAILTRASEVVWAAPAFLLFLPFAGRDGWRRLGWAVVGAALPAFLFFQTNATLYGAPFKTPYVAAPAPTVITASETVSPAVAVSVPMLPFGFDAKRVLRNAWGYGLCLFWWQSLLAVIGFIVWCVSARRAPRPQKVYALAAILASTWLAVLYGSWFIRDRLDPTHITIGTSYVRYFLPAYVAILPFGALALNRLATLVKKPYIVATVLLLCGVCTARVAVFAGDESLMAVRQTLEQNAAKRDALLQEIPEGAVLMTERFDKLVVPDRLRIIPTIDAGGFAAAALAASEVPVYWYGLTPSPEETARLNALAAEQGLALSSPRKMNASETLYLLQHE